MKKIITGLFVLIIFITYVNAGEKEVDKKLQNKRSLTISEIVEKANLASYYAGRDGRSSVKMEITDSKGRVRIRELIILRMDVKDGGDQKFYVYFKKPADVRKMTYMVWKHVDKDDDRWMYLPALDLVKRIAASNKRSSFVGSHFTYEDVSGRNVTDDVHKLVSEDDKYFILDNIPKEPDKVEFKKFRLWIDKKNFLPVKAYYYNESDTVYRTVEALEIKILQDIPTVTKAVAKDMIKGGSTINTFSDIKYNIGLNDKIFSKRYLRRIPRRWLR